MSLAPLDPLLHAQLRLAIMSLLLTVESADFNYLLEETNASKGNLSVQIKKLKEAKYVAVTKTFKDNYPHTEVAMTETGRAAFQKYIDALSDYLNPK